MAELLEVERESADPSAELFEAPAFFSQRTNSLVFRCADVDAVMRGHDPYLFALIEPFMAGRQARQGRLDDAGRSLHPLQTSPPHLRAE